MVEIPDFNSSFNFLITAFLFACLVLKGFIGFKRASLGSNSCHATEYQAFENYVLKDL